MKFNLDVPIINYRPFFANCTEHELTHAKQYAEIDLLRQGKLSGERAKLAEKYDENFKNYIDFDVDQKAYDSQIIEAEALEKGYGQQEKICILLESLQNKFKQGKLLENQLGLNYAN